MIQKIYNFFDKLEDKIRGHLSRWPIFYAFVGGVGIVIFWRGVWHTADSYMEYLFTVQAEGTVNVGGLPWWDGPLSLLVGTLILLLTGVFVSGFIGNEIIISGLRGEKKLTEKTEKELKTEANVLKDIKKQIKALSDKLDKIQN